MFQRTRLHATHQQAGARLIEFGGWEMPVRSSSIVDEHLAVRRAAGIFDISHMGEFLVAGSGALEFLNGALTNDLRKLAVGQGQYTLMCHEDGGVVDDLYAYRVAEQEYLLIVNASRISADWDWLQGRYDASRVAGGIELRNASAEFDAVAVQGPRVASFMEAAISGGSIQGTFVGRVTDLKKNETGAFVWNGATLHVARTGYTGEDGFEIIAPAGCIVPLWEKIMAAGHAGCLQPAGLGARDTLRTEMCYPLYGHELDEHTTPIEAGLGFFVALDKGEFTGRAVLARQKAEGVAKKLAAFKMTDKSAPPRPQYTVWAGGAKIGTVVSGTQSPSLQCGIGLAYVQPEFAAPGTPLEIEIRGKNFPAVTVKKPLYQKPAPAAA